MGKITSLQTFVFPISNFRYYLTQPNVYWTADRAGGGWVRHLNVRRRAAAVHSQIDIYSLVVTTDHIVITPRTLTKPCRLL